MKIDINKKYRTRDGSDVIIHTTEGRNDEFPVIGEIRDEDGVWCIDQWRADGGDGLVPASDLVEVREPREFWIVETPHDQTTVLQFEPSNLSDGWTVIHVREVMP